MKRAFTETFSVKVTLHKLFVSLISVKNLILRTIGDIFLTRWEIPVMCNT